MDLPFAQKRWCGVASVERVHLSDHKEAVFENKYGLLIKELRLLARSVIILDREGAVRYNELVGEITKEPDYEKVRAGGFKRAALKTKGEKDDEEIGNL